MIIRTAKVDTEKTPKEIIGTLKLFMYVTKDRKAGTSRQITLDTFYCVKPSDIELVVAVFKDTNPQLELIDIFSKFDYTIVNTHYGL